MRLLGAFTALAVVLVLAVPAFAEDLVEVENECEDGGYCTKSVTVETETLGFEEQYDDGEEVVVEEVPVPVVEPVDVEPVPAEEEEEAPFLAGTDEECFPFCGAEFPF